MKLKPHLSMPNHLFHRKLRIFPPNVLCIYRSFFLFFLFRDMFFSFFFPLYFIVFYYCFFLNQKKKNKSLLRAHFKMLLSCFKNTYSSLSLGKIPSLQMFHFCCFQPKKKAENRRGIYHLSDTPSGTTLFK